MAGSSSACETLCEQEERCEYYSYWDTGWCVTTESCTTLGQQPQYKIDIIQCTTSAASTPPPPPSYPPGAAPASPPPPTPKSCTNVISSQAADYCSGSRLYGGMAGSSSACETLCEQEERCEYYSYWDTGWCVTTESCTTLGQQPQYKIDIIQCTTSAAPTAAPIGATTPTSRTSTVR